MKISILRFPSSNVLSAYFFALLSLLYFALRAIRLKAMRAVGMRGGCFSPFAFYLCISAFICGCFSYVGYASPQPSAENNVHFCLPLNLEDTQVRDSIYAATKHALNLNVGEPRTVRMIYFLPNDRPFRQEVVDSMKVAIRQIQTFYAEQMQAHGHGSKTFRFEIDAQGDPVVHRLDGQYPDSHYLDNTPATVDDEFKQVFDTEANNVYLFVIDNSIDAIGTGNGRRAGGVGGGGRNNGSALVPGGFSFHTAAHELGHGFGLSHDFNDNAYIMSYGGGLRHSLSACSAEFLAVHPYFNLNIPDEATLGPTIELISPSIYPAGSTSVSVQLKVSDSDGLHQAILFVITREPHFAAGGAEVKACRGFAGEREAIVEFDYDGVIPSGGGTSLSNLFRHKIIIWAVDTEGNVDGEDFSLLEISPHRIATLEGHTSSVRLVAFSPDGTTLASASRDSTVKVWNLATKENIATLRHTHSILSVAFSPDGTTFALGAPDSTIKLWDIATKENIATLEGHTHRVRSVAFSPDGAMLASGSSDRTVKLWDIATGRTIATLEGHESWVYSVAYSPNGTMLASGSSDDTVKLWDVTTKENIATLEGHAHAVSSVAFSPDGTTLASGASDSTIKVWDVATKENIATLRHTHRVRSVAFSPDGAMFASGSRDATIKLWNVVTRQNIATYKHIDEHSGFAAFNDLPFVWSVAFSPDGTTLASGGGSGTVILWDMSALGLGGSSQATFSLSLDGDGAAGDQAVTSLDVSPGSVVSLQIFGKDIQNADGISVRFEYDATQVLYEGFDPGDVLPNAQVLALPSTNPTAIEVSLVSFGGKAAVHSGLVGSVRFLTTSAFSGTTLRLVRAELGRGGQLEEVTFDNTTVALQLVVLTPDFNGDGRVGFDDFVLFVGQFGLSRGDEQYDEKYDLDEDGTIGFGDFLIFGRSFGKEEKERFEPEGLVLIDSGNRFFRYFQGQIDASGGRAGHLEVPNGGLTAKWRIMFLDDHGDEIDPPDDPDSRFTSTIADPSVVEIYQAPADVGKFEFQLRGLKADETTIILEVTHNDQVNFRTAPIPVHVVDQ